MTLTKLFIVCAFLVLVGCTPTTPEMRVVNDAASAIGGKERIQAINTLMIEGEGENFNLGQNKSPDAELPVYKVTEFQRAIDFTNGRWRQEQTRVPNFPTGNPNPQKQIAAVDGSIAFNVAADGTATRVSDMAARDRRTELHHHPVGILRLALAQGAQLSNARKEGNFDAVDVATSQGDKLTLFVDSASKLPAKVASTSYNVNLGDVAVETEFKNYEDAGGLQLPSQLISRLDKYNVADIHVTKSAINTDVGNLAAPDAVKSAAAPTPTANVTVEQVAKGVWYLAGQSHHSVLVEFADHLTLIEAPQNETRTLAVIAKARELKPDKPLKYVVNTHHHFDHSGGIRAAVAEGLTVITHEQNKAFYEDVVARKHTIVADALAKNPKPLTIETVGDKHILKDATRTVELHHIAGNPHADTLLMVYFPAERLLTQADVYSPPAPNAPPPPAFPFAGNLLENIQKNNLRVDRLMPIHGRIVPFNELRTAAQSTPKSSE